MANQTVARRYAAAVFQLAAEANVVAAVRKDLHTIADAIGEDETTKNFFLSPVIERSEKERVLSSALAGKMHELALHALLLLVRKRREALLREIVIAFDELEMRARDTESLIVTSAKRLSPEELRGVVARLEKTYAKKFDVRQNVDPSLIGGLRITLGDRRIDGSVEGRLERLSRSLFADN